MGTSDDPDLSGPERVLLDWAEASEVDADRPESGTIVLTLPGEHKLATAVSVRIGAHDASFQAFVIRAPEQDAERVHRWLLLRNARVATPAFMIDPLGDIYLTASLPVAGVVPEVVDGLMARFALTADESFDSLLSMGFLESMRREWRWRIARGESTANLAAFAHLLDDDA